MRYFIKLAYVGTDHHGWQYQPGGVKTIQGDIQNAIYTITRESVEVVGCGRTDTGVHAKDYYMHVDMSTGLDDRWLGRINKYLPDTIVLKHYREVAVDAHARYDAYSRSYEYHMHFDKDPFLRDRSYYMPYSDLQMDLLLQSAEMLLEYTHFDTFCKTNTDVKKKNCALTRSEWKIDDNKAVYHVTANRFLRGMIRLIVGMSIRVARGVISMEYVREQIEKQQPLDKAWSVPAHGLYLCNIKYPYPVDPPFK